VKTRLRPKHRRALLAALPPLAADLHTFKALIPAFNDLPASKRKGKAGFFCIVFVKQRAVCS
jgi:hypothetical protein